MSVFRKAERRRVKLRVALDGPSGSGKTHSALRLALGLLDGKPTREDGTNKIVVIDSEKGSAELEAGKQGIPPFDTARLDPPFSPDRYIKLMELAAAEKYEVIIVDSISHAWSGTGGVLDIKDKIPGKDSFAAWRKVTPIHNKLVDAFLSSPAHVICTMRTKTAYEYQEVDGKKKPVKIGLKPEMREGVEYEFTLVFDIQHEGHIATPSKDRTSLFQIQGEVERSVMLTDEHGKELLNFVMSGADAPAPPPLELPEDKPWHVQQWEKLKEAIPESRDLFALLCKQASFEDKEQLRKPSVEQQAKLENLIDEEIKNYIGDGPPPEEPPPPDPEQSAKDLQDDDVDERSKEPAPKDEIDNLYELTKRYVGVKSRKEFHRTAGILVDEIIGGDQDITRGIAQALRDRIDKRYGSGDLFGDGS